MKNFSILILLSLVFISSATIYSNDNSDEVFTALKLIINAGVARGADANANAGDAANEIVQIYQFTATTIPDNKNFFDVVSFWDSYQETLLDVGLSSRDKGKFIILFKDRSPERLLKLWNKYKNQLFMLVSKDALIKLLQPTNGTIKDLSYTSAIDSRESPLFNEYMKKMGKAGENNYNEYLSYSAKYNLDFWYRRYLEGNLDVVYLILRD